MYEPRLAEPLSRARRLSARMTGSGRARLTRRSAFGLAAAIAFAFAIWRVAHAIADWGLWHEALLMRDPSAAELYEVNFWFEIAFITLATLGGIAALAIARRFRLR